MDIELYSFAECEPLARGVAAELGLGLRPVVVHHFPDGESLVQVRSERPGRALLFRSLDHPNERLVELLFAADALRRQGVTRLGLVCPYLGYMRQDAVFEPGQALSQAVVARWLGDAFDDVLTVEAHLHRVHTLSEIYACPALSISAAPVIAEWLASRGSDSVLIGPDRESEPWIRAIAERAGLHWAIATKRRHGDRDVRIDMPALPERTRSAWIVDDVGSSGGTLESVARLLRQRGVESIGAIVVHALFDAETPARLERAGIHPLVSCDGVEHPSNQIALAPLLAREIERRWASREVA
jgi:ribose-phosphate pyrophosphokinase